ncbi:MAG: putative integral rane protein [Ilumatobacteraceae bacterium]|nr:putative integral rane protein [Ilumatobacteraceae bacterium]
MRRDLRIQWQMFLGVALFIAVIDVVYWFVSYERAGTTMLTLASGLALLCGSWLFIQDHRRPPRESTSISPAVHSAEPYLPTASWWPLVIGAGAALGLNGLILSWPYAIPGAAVLALGIGGLVNDSRRRT